MLLVGGVCAAAVIVFGAVAVLFGFLEQHSANHTYHAEFSRPGAGCGSSGQDFDITNGDPLSCEPSGMLPMSTQADFSGFTDSQNSQVTTLAKRLGTDGLADTEQRQIQGLVDKFAAEVPSSRRPHYDEGVGFGPLWGTHLAEAGGIAAAIGAAALYLGMRQAARR